MTNMAVNTVRIWLEFGPLSIPVHTVLLELKLLLELKSGLA